MHMLLRAKIVLKPFTTYLQKPSPLFEARKNNNSRPGSGDESAIIDHTPPRTAENHLQKPVEKIYMYIIYILTIKTRSNFIKSS